MLLQPVLTNKLLFSGVEIDTPPEHSDALSTAASTPPPSRNNASSSDEQREKRSVISDNKGSSHYQSNERSNLQMIKVGDNAGHVYETASSSHTDADSQSSSHESKHQFLNETPRSVCVPWWVFVLFMTVLSIIYLVALFGCLYLTNQNSQRNDSSELGTFYTPAKSYYPDQCSARKRTPPAFANYYDMQ